MRRQVHDDPLDPFDPIEDDGDDILGNGFHITTADGLALEDSPFCDFGNGDDDDLCVQARWGCHFEGCPKVQNF